MKLTRTTTSETDPAVIVTGSGGAEYPCPDIATLDEHILGLRTRIARTDPALSTILRAYWADIDLLLDRRIWLELTLDAA